jgi:hypothetical protein
MKSEQHIRARLRELESKTALTPDEDAEASDLREKLQGGDDPDSDSEVAVTVRFPSRVWEGLGSAARDERMSKNAAVVRAVEKYSSGGQAGATQEISGLAQALAGLDASVCPAEHAATRKAYRQALARNYGVTVEADGSESRTGNSPGAESEGDYPESEEQLRKRYALYEEAVKKLPWLKQHSRRFRSFNQFRSATAAERRSEFKRLDIAEPWSPRASGRRKALTKAGS